MCGIAGIWGQTEQTNVEAMMKSIIHRGPDAKGIFTVPNGSGILGHQRSVSYTHLTLPTKA